MLIVKQKRTRVIPSAIASGAESTRLIVPVTGNKVNIEQFELDGLQQSGDIILPKAVGPATRRNLLGRLIVHRNQEKDPYSYRMLWGRTQFCGREETEWVEDWITRHGFRYPRTQLPAENIEISLIENEKGEQFYATEQLQHNNPERWVTAANVMLEIFGFFWAIQPEEIELPLMITRRVNWHILPPGKTPFSSSEPALEKVIQTLKNKVHQNHARRSLKSICKQKPDSTMMGSAGFHGYVIFCFDRPEGSFAILENIQPNNATYIIGIQWEQIAKLSKKEILENDLHLARLIHGKSWEAEIDKWFNEHAA